LFSFESCTLDEKSKPLSKKAYFDIKEFFEGEINRLSNEKPTIYKEIQKNGQKEGKTITIKDWAKELDLFIESDINKPAWLTSYKTDINSDTTNYTALADELRVRSVQIIKIENRIASIKIESRDVNKLYESNERLSYYPDSLYVIKKSQHVKIIGNNNYQITGDFTTRKGD